MPIPTTPQFLTPADGATVDASVQFSWTQSTLAVAPTVALVLPASGANVQTGTALTLAATATDATSVSFSVDGGAALAATFNSGTNRWERSYTPATSKSYSFTATATNSTGSATTTARTFTASASVPAPTVAMVSPANGATVTSGVPLLLAATGTNITSLEFEVNDSGSMLPATWNASTSQWERTITPSTIATHTVNATATGAGGTTQSASVSFTVVAAGSAIANAYFTAVNAKRTALSQAALATTEKDRITDMLERFADRDGEITSGTDWAAKLVEGIILRSAYNVGSGDEVLTLVGRLTGTREGATKPTWGTTGMSGTGANGTAVRFAAPGFLAGLGEMGIIVVAAGAGSAATQHLLSSGSVEADRLSISRGSSVANSVNLTRNYAPNIGSSTNITVASAAGQMSSMKMTALAASGDTVYARTLPIAGGGTTTTQSPSTSGGKTDLAASTIDAESITLFGHDVNGLTTTLNGTIALMLFFNGWNETDFDDLAAIVAATVGTGLSLT